MAMSREWLTSINIDPKCHSYLVYRAVGRSENPGVPVLFSGNKLPPLVEIGLTDLPKFGGAMAPPAPPGTTGLVYSGQLLEELFI